MIVERSSRNRPYPLAIGLFLAVLLSLHAQPVLGGGSTTTTTESTTSTTESTTSTTESTTSTTESTTSTTESTTSTTESTTSTTESTTTTTESTTTTTESTTTTTESTTTTTASTTSTTSTTLLETLHLLRAQLRQNTGATNGAIRLRGEFVDTVPAFSAPPAVEVEVTDNLGLSQMHVFLTCTTIGSRTRCKDGTSPSYVVDFRPFRQQPEVIRFAVTFKRLAIDGPFQAPVTLTIRHNGVVVRIGDINDCRSAGGGLNCREF